MFEQSLTTEELDRAIARPVNAELRGIEQAVAKLEADAVQGQKEAERSQRVAVAGFESEAVAGENTAKATIAQVNAELAEKEVEAKLTAEVARANAERDIRFAA